MNKDGYTLADHGKSHTGPGGAKMVYDYGDESWEVRYPGGYARFYDEAGARWFVDNYGTKEE